MSTLALNDPPELRLSYILSPWYRPYKRGVRAALSILRAAPATVRRQRIHRALEVGDVRAAAYMLHWNGEPPGGRKPARRVVKQAAEDAGYKIGDAGVGEWVLLHMEMRHGCRFSLAETIEQMEG